MDKYDNNYCIVQHINQLMRVSIFYTATHNSKNVRV